MFSSSIKFKNFKEIKSTRSIKKDLNKFLKEKNESINSLGKNYQYSFNIKNLSKFKKYRTFRLIGMGGSILGTQTIYDFLKDKIKKNFFLLIIYKTVKIKIKN